MARKKVVKPTAAPTKGSAAVEVVEVKKVIAGAAVGIDFGTHGVSLAAYKNGSFEVIVNDNGERSTPLYVSFNDLERAIGAPAKDASLRNHSNSVHYIRSYLGSNYAGLAEYLKQITTYKVVDNADGQACFSVVVKGETLLVTPDELITLFSEKLMKYASDFWDCSVTNAVVAIPFAFPEAARNALVNAIEAAGFKVLATISDPIAAALSFNLDTSMEDTDKNYDTPASLLSSATADQKCILIADIGCVKSTATLVRSKNGILEVIHSNTSDVAGATLDNKLHDYFSELFTKQNNMDLKDSHRANLRLRHACEMIKRNLSSSIQADLQLDALYDGIDLFTDITRVKFEQMCQSVWDEFNNQLTDVFAHGHGVKPSDITHVILGGGTAALAKFQQHIQAFFRKQTGFCKVEFLKHMHSGDAVVFGAAKQAYMLSLASYDDVEALRAGMGKNESKQNTDGNVRHTISAYKQPLLVLSKNLYIKTFYNTFLPLIGTATSAPSISSVRIAVPSIIPEGFAAAIQLYETSASNAVAASTASDLTCVGTYALDTSIINSLGSTPEGEVPVVCFLQCKLDKDYVFTLDAGYTSSAITGPMTYKTITSYNMLSKPLVCPKTKVDFVHTDNTAVSAHSQRMSIAKIQQMAAHWTQWKNAPRNINFVKKHTHMNVVVANASKIVDKLQPILNLGNPYVQSNVASAVDVTGMPSANNLAEMAIALRDAIVRVVRTKGMSVAEARAYNKDIKDVVISFSAAPASNSAELVEEEVNYDDISGDDDDDDSIDYEQYLNGDDDDDDESDYAAAGSDLD